MIVQLCIGQKHNKKGFSIYTETFLAGAAGLEPATNGFGDHYSTN
jgi:hypothetical protein